MVFLLPEPKSAVSTSGKVVILLAIQDRNSVKVTGSAWADYSGLILGIVGSWENLGILQLHAYTYLISTNGM